MLVKCVSPNSTHPTKSFITVCAKTSTSCTLMQINSCNLRSRTVRYQDAPTYRWPGSVRSVLDQVLTPPKLILQQKGRSTPPRSTSRKNSVLPFKLKAWDWGAGGLEGLYRRASAPKRGEEREERKCLPSGQLGHAQMKAAFDSRRKFCRFL